MPLFFKIYGCRQPIEGESRTWGAATKELIRIPEASSDSDVNEMESLDSDPHL